MINDVLTEIGISSSACRRTAGFHSAHRRSSGKAAGRGGFGPEAPRRSSPGRR